MLRILLAAAAVLAACTAIWSVDPAVTPWLPVCPLHALTGLYCPGCGSMRALHQLAHGDVVAAWKLNPLLMLMLPLLIYVLTPQIRSGLSNRPVRPVSLPSSCSWLLPAALAAFGIARNLPIYPFTLLAPR